MKPCSQQHALTCVPLTDGPTSTLAIAWPEGARSRALAALVDAAATRPTD
jgi:LysR family transcriptional regulator, benzoate and cis,cis-muconate-responsive activator of ben and cat genes